MAEIWVVSAGPPAQKVTELDERPFADCVDLLELTENRYLGQDPTQTPAKPDFGLPDRTVIVATGEDETASLGWKPGYYFSPLEVAEALKKLGIGDTELG